MVVDSCVISASELVYFFFEATTYGRKNFTILLDWISSVEFPLIEQIERVLFFSSCIREFNFRKM